MAWRLRHGAAPLEGDQGAPTRGPIDTHRQAQFKDLIELFPVADEFVPLQKGGFRNLRALSALGRRSKPECQVMFTNSVRGDLEAWFVGAQNRVGMVYPGRHRPLLTGVYRLSAFKDELDVTHQTALLEDFLKSFDLIDSVDVAPFFLGDVERVPNRVGIIAGSSNNPQKCWAVENWCRMMARFSESIPGSEFVLFGTESDRSISEAVSKGTTVTTRDRTGQTNMRELASQFPHVRLSGPVSSRHRCALRNGLRNRAIRFSAKQHKLTSGNALRKPGYHAAPVFHGKLVPHDSPVFGEHSRK